MQDLHSLVLPTAPPLDPAWIAYEDAAGLRAPRSAVSHLERQPLYAAQCRALNGGMMGPEARDHYLSQGISSKMLTAPSSHDDYGIPVLRYENVAAMVPTRDEEEEVIIVYYHGGGLYVGEADSEDLTCRRLMKAELGRVIKIYSVGYRLMPQHVARVCLADALDGFEFARAQHPHARILVVGSSSGGELAALVSQAAPRGSLGGVLLRCPVTCDATSDQEYVPEKFRAAHTSRSLSFETTLMGAFKTATPRDGLERMPLEASVEDLAGMPRTWVQICTNDVLYSDGLCYAMVLRDAGVEVRVDVVRGWPHTFWLKAPQLDRALQADEAMLEGLAWVLKLPHDRN